MPLDLNNLGTEEFTLDYGAAGSLTVAFYPDRFTEQTISEMYEYQGRDPEDVASSLKTLAALNRLLVRHIARWDLLEGGVPVPLTEAALPSVSLFVRMAVLNRLMQAVNSLDPKALATSPLASPATRAPTARRTSPKHR